MIICWFEFNSYFMKVHANEILLKVFTTFPDLQEDRLHNDTLHISSLLVHQSGIYAKIISQKHNHNF